MGLFNAYTVAATWVTGGFTVAMELLNTAFLATPIGWIALAIGGLIGTIMYLWNHVEGFRAAMIGMWGALQGFFSGVWGLIKAYIGSLVDAWVGLFTLDFDKLVGALKGDKLVAAYKDLGEKTMHGYSEGHKKGVESFKADQAKDKKGTAKVDSTISGNNSVANGGNGGAGSGSGSGGTVGGAKNIDIIINKLVETININVTNLSESTGQMKEEVGRTLIAVVNDTIQMAGQ